MKAFVRFTAMAFMVLGVIIILIGLYIAVSGLLGQATTNPTTSLIPDFFGLFKWVNVIAGGAVGLQGLFLAAIGQALWLLATISDETEKASTYLYALVPRDAQPKQ